MDQNAPLTSPSAGPRNESSPGGVPGSVTSPHRCSMRRSRRADADTPRDTPGDVEATRAAANAASSEEDSSNPSALDKEPVRVTTGFTQDLHMNTHEYCYQPRSRLDHAPGEDTDAPTNVATGRALGDDDVGSVSTVCSDMDSDFVDVALEACSWHAPPERSVG